MKFALVIAAVLSASTSFADIRRANPEVDTRTVTGAAAKRLMTTMGGVHMRGSSLRTSFSTYQVKRNDDGLKQIICEATTSNLTHKTDVRCTIETSLNGVPLAVFRPVIRMG